MDINMWFTYKCASLNFRDYAKEEKHCPIVIYLYKHPDDGEESLEFYNSSFDWNLILSDKKFWIWKPKEKELAEISYEKIFLFPKRTIKKYKKFEYIEKKYLKNPSTIDEIVEGLKLSDKNLKKKIKEILKNSESKNFYISEWVQNN